jgi:hypothetical protein
MPAAVRSVAGPGGARRSARAADGGVAGESVPWFGTIRSGAPVVDRDDAGLQRFQAVEELGHLGQ